jgi:hypothetical protein
VRLFTTEDGLVRNWSAHPLDNQGGLWFCTVEDCLDGWRFVTTVRSMACRIVNDIVGDVA